MRCKLENPIQTKSGYVPQNQHNRMTSTFCRVVGCGKQAKHSRRATSCCQQDYVLPHVLLHGSSLRGMVRIVQSVTVLLLWVFISGCFYFPVRSHEMTQIVSWEREGERGTETEPIYVSVSILFTTALVSPSNSSQVLLRRSSELNFEYLLFYFVGYYIWILSHVHSSESFPSVFFRLTRMEGQHIFCPLILSIWKRVAILADWRSSHFERKYQHPSTRVERAGYF